jgi:capsular exopolysaccharide synthesis family protein
VGPPPSYVVEEEQPTHLREYWRILVRHRWAALALLLMTVVVGAVYTYSQPNIYSATATVRIEKEEPRILKIEQVAPPPTQADDYYQTQYRMLQSRTLANRVIDQLNLTEHPEFNNQLAPRGLSHWAGAITQPLKERVNHLLVRWVAATPTVERPIAEIDMAGAVPSSPYTGMLLEKLQVEPVRNSRLVKVTFNTLDRGLAPTLANALADSYIGQNLEQKLDATQYASKFLTTQLQQVKGALEASEERLAQFIKKQNLLVTTDRPDLGAGELSKIGDDLTKVRLERIQKEALLRQMRESGAETLPATVLASIGNSSILQGLKGELLRMEAEYTKLGEIYTPEYPRIQRLRVSIREMKRQIEGEMDRIRASIEADYEAARKQEEKLEEAFEAKRSGVRQVTYESKEFGILKREVDTNRELYASLLQRLKETGVSAGLLTSNIQIVDRAEVPGGPSWPRRGLNLLLALIMGLSGGVGLAFFLEYLDTTLRGPEEVERILRVPTIGVVPSLGSLQGRRRRGELERPPQPFALTAHHDMKSVLSEAFRNLRTSLLFSSPDHPPKTILFTSLGPGDGKTALSVNTAVTLAQMGKEVLLIDCDMRGPDCHRVFRVSPSPGLSNFLTGNVELPGILRSTEVPNLYLIPAGRVPLNPAELLGSDRMARSLELLSERFAHIVIDSPPLFGVSDSAILANRVEGVVLVLAHGRASREAAQRAIHHLGAVRARLLGVVLNWVNAREDGYGYGYGYGRYGYGVYGDADSRGEIGDDGSGP